MDCGNGILCNLLIWSSYTFTNFVSVDQSPGFSTSETLVANGFIKLISFFMLFFLFSHALSIFNFTSNYIAMFTVLVSWQSYFASRYGLAMILCHFSGVFISFVELLFSTFLVIILRNFTISEQRSDSLQVKQNLIFSIIKLVYDLPHKLSNNYNFGSLEIRKNQKNLK